MRASLSKLLNGITLLGLGGVLISFVLNGRIEQYLHPQFRPLVLGAAVLFCVAGTVYLLARSSMKCCVDGECVHQNNQSPIRAVAAFGLLFVPLATGALVSSDAFDRQAILNRGFVQDASTLPVRSSAKVQPQPMIPAAALGADNDAIASAVPLPQNGDNSQAMSGAADPNTPGPNEEEYLPRAADGNVALEVTDLLYGESEPSLRDMFSGKKIELIGQFLPGQTPTKFKLVRMFIVCCAADARPVAVPVEVPEQVACSDMSWVKVVGEAVYTRADGKEKVTVKADRVEQTAPPADAMLY